MYCLGPNPMCHATHVAQARGFMSRKTDRGTYFPLTHARTSQGQYQSSRNQEHRRTNMQIRGTKMKPEKQDTIRRRASFAGQERSARGEATPGRRRPRRPGRACQDTRRQNHLTNYVLRHDPRRKVTKWQPSTTWQPLSTGNAYR